LEGGAVYEFKVKAVNRAGDGPASAAITKTIANLGLGAVDAARAAIEAESIGTYTFASSRVRGNTASVDLPVEQSNIQALLKDTIDVVLTTAATAFGSNVELDSIHVLTYTPAENGTPSVNTGTPGSFTFNVGLRKNTGYVVTNTITGAITVWNYNDGSNTDIPAAPTVQLTPGNAQLTINFNTPETLGAELYDGGDLITRYDVTVRKDPAGTPSTTTISLTPPVALPFIVAADNDVEYEVDVQAFTVADASGGAVGTSTRETPSASVTVPGAPATVTAVATTDGTGEATVTFTPPTNLGGGTISSYTLTVSDGNVIFNAVSPVTVTGLIVGDPYTFSVTATNEAGEGPAKVSSPVIPKAPAASVVKPGAPATVSAVATTDGTGAAEV
jgi:predicted RNA-binding protein with TRAM domain